MQFILTQTELDALVPKAQHDELIATFDRKDSVADDLRESIEMLPDDMKLLVYSKYAELRMMRRQE